MSDISSFAQGLANGINSYMQGNIQQKRQQENIAFQGQQNLQNQESLEQFKENEQGYMTPETAGSLFGAVSPELGNAAKQTVTNWMNANGGKPMPMEVAKSSMDPILTAFGSKQLASALKNQNTQNQLEKQAMDRVTQVRGDQSLMRAEAQRDASGMAYDTIAKAQSEGRDLSQVEYSDLLGQLWKARTGSAPTNEVMKDLDQRTAKEGINRVITYATGNPNLIGATTGATLDNIKQFVTSTGSKADQQWNAYMQPRLVKPTGLDQDRWDHIISQNRGISFADQKSVSDKSYPSIQKIRVKRLQDNATGTINANDFDPNKYQKL